MKHQPSAEEPRSVSTEFESLIEVVTRKVLAGERPTPEEGDALLNFLLREIEGRIAAEKLTIAAGMPKHGLRLCPRCRQPLARRRFRVANRISRMERWRCDPCAAWFRRGETVTESSLGPSEDCRVADDGLALAEPEGKRAPNGGENGREHQAQANRREDWHHDWGVDIRRAGIIDELHATFPRDGRETIFEEYERIAPTSTVGEYEAAARRTRDRDLCRTEDPELPDDFDAYLTQRIPSYEMLLGVDPDTKIDRYGQLIE